MVWVEQEPDISLCSIDSGVQLLRHSFSLYPVSKILNVRPGSVWGLCHLPQMQVFEQLVPIWGCYCRRLQNLFGHGSVACRARVTGSSGWPWFWLMLSVSWTTEIWGVPAAALLLCTFPCLFCLDLTPSDCDPAVPLTVNYFASDEGCTWCWHGWIHFTLICTVNSREEKLVEKAFLLFSFDFSLACLFCGRISCSPGRSWTLFCVAKDDLERLLLLPLPPEC